MSECDVDSVVLRLLCEKAEERLERQRTANEIAHRTFQMPSGLYRWAVREGEQDQPR